MNTPPIQSSPSPLPMETSPAMPTEAPATLTPTPPFPDSLTTAELHQRLDPFDDPACLLPCYNGLTVGQSTMHDVLVFYSHLGIGIRDLIPGDYEAAQEGTGRLGAWLTKTSDVTQAEEMGLAPPVVNIQLKDGVAQSLYIGWEYYPPYLTISRVLDHMGQPDRLELALVFGDDPVSFLLELVYADAGVGFAFYGSTLGDSTYRVVCLSEQQITVTFLGIFAPNTIPMAGLANSSFLLPLIETLGLDYAHFVEQVAAGECLEITSEQWQAWLALSP